MAANDPLTFYAPIVLFSRNILSVVPEAGLKVMGLSIPSRNVMLRNASTKKEFKESPGWILEANGRFRELEPRGSRNDWAAPISFLIQFVKSEFELSEARNITVGDLKALLENVADDLAEAPQAADLREHLRKYNDKEIISESILRDWPI